MTRTARLGLRGMDAIKDSPAEETSPDVSAQAGACATHQHRLEQQTTPPRVVLEPLGEALLTFPAIIG
jgi:hypothetical protein